MNLWPHSDGFWFHVQVAETISYQDMNQVFGRDLTKNCPQKYGDTNWGSLECRTGQQMSQLSSLIMIANCGGFTWFSIPPASFGHSASACFRWSSWCEPRHDKTNKMCVCPVWSESSLCSQWVATDPMFLHANSADSDQTGRIWVFAQGAHSFCWFCHVTAHVMLRICWQQQTDLVCKTDIFHLFLKILMGLLIVFHSMCGTLIFCFAFNISHLPMELTSYQLLKSSKTTAWNIVKIHAHFWKLLP